MNAGLADVIVALRRWCAYASRADRSAWLRQVRRLYLLGPRFREEIKQLVSFANSNANRPKFLSKKIEDASRVEDEDDVDIAPEPAAVVREAT